ncbi:MAG: tautomerase family protein [Aurantimonas coralicida]|nr:tautomerase family protein [Aurantimonas coralicida]
MENGYAACRYSTHQGVFTPEQKKEMIETVTDAMVRIEGEAMRGVTWVRIQELASGEWGIGGKAITTNDILAMQSASALEHA